MPAHHAGLALRVDVMTLAPKAGLAVWIQRCRVMALDSITC